jgi:Ni,Fe-hydrogenase I small subunit
VVADPVDAGAVVAAAPVLPALLVAEAAAVAGLPYWSSGGVVDALGVTPRNCVIIWVAAGSCVTCTSSL